MRLLIVDDSLIMRSTIELFAKEMGLEIVGKASDGKQALALFQELLPDIVTLDITMPEMDGLQVLQEILKIKPSTRILVVTAITEKGVALQVLQKGAKGFLNKPFTAETLKEALGKVIHA